jgi:hypothetical protein
MRKEMSNREKLAIIRDNEETRMITDNDLTKILGIL